MATRFVHILVIDDEALIRRATKRLLATAFRDQFEIAFTDADTVEEGVVALDMAGAGDDRHGPIHLIICDQNTPGTLKGTEFLEKLRAMGNPIPFILMSDNVGRPAVDEVISRCDARGVQKPDVTAELTRFVRAFLLDAEP